MHEAVRAKNIYWNLIPENITALKKNEREVSYCLQDNKQWKVPVTTILDTLIDECDKKSFKGKIYIYNPMHTLYTLYLIAAHNNIMNWAPCFSLSWNIRIRRTYILAK